jgi:predicted P-loop ATPase
MPVLEHKDQGINKSSALEILAIKKEWFSDSFNLNAKDREAIEQLRGHLIIEVPELSGMRRAEVEHVKATLSRSTDRGRLAYDRTVSEVRRQNIFVGTTNSSEYLKDTTGNRRFWPVSVKWFNLDALRRDLDQLWAETVMREASGISIRLDQKLWSKAAEEQKQRLIQDPFYDLLQPHLEQVTYRTTNESTHKEELVEVPDVKITSETVWEILDMRGGQRTQDHNQRMGKAMRDLGWRRANTAGTVSIDGKMVVGFAKGNGKDKPWYIVEAIRSMGTLHVIVRRGNEPGLS